MAKKLMLVNGKMQLVEVDTAGAITGVIATASQQKATPTKPVEVLKSMKLNDIQEPRPREDLPSGINEQVLSRINQLRRQMLVHSLIYYRLQAEPLIDDAAFDKRGKELVHLQKNFPVESQHGIYYTAFADWDATTGYHLPQDGWIYDKAVELVRGRDEMKKKVAKPAKPETT